MPDQSNSPKYQRLPLQRWHIYPARDKQAQQLAAATNLSPLITQVLINRGIETTEQGLVYLNPDSQFLPTPLEEFPDLAISVDLLIDAITSHQKIAICGDYDADGMTSTALLLRALRHLGAKVDYAIPSRMKDGYGINSRIVEEFHREEVSLILTVDNGISAYEPIDRARQLGIKVIVTDHHDLPEKLPPADAILNPKLLPELSPYRGLAGVGVAYVLAVTLAQKLGKLQGLTKSLLELYTLGTIADLAPLTGVNRRWLKRGLRELPHSQLKGVQALIEVAGVKSAPGSGEQANPTLFAALSNGGKNAKTLKPEDIGFKLGPRINAVGRLDDPQIVIDLLTTDDMGVAQERARQCEEINQRRQQLCEEIEREAVDLCEQNQISFQQQRVLVIVQAGWHHGVIGIVASRLVERYGVPVFIGTYEDDGHIRGSARSIPEFHVFEALEFCHDLLEKYGGHRAAGGFSFSAKKLGAFRERLSKFAHQCLEPQHLKPLISIDARANFGQIDLNLYKQIDSLHPCGIENPDPVFWTPEVRVVSQQIVGKGHIKLILEQDGQQNRIKAIAWRWGDYFPLPSQIDIAYKLQENNWNGNTNIELVLVGVRLPVTSSPTAAQKKAEFYHNDRRYTCSLVESLRELRIRNPQGKVLAIQRGQRVGFLGIKREEADEVDVTKPPYFDLIKAALSALETK